MLNTSSTRLSQPATDGGSLLWSRSQIMEWSGRLEADLSVRLVALRVLWVLCA